MYEDREKLLSAAKAFCQAFADKKSLDEIVSHFSESDEVRAIELGDDRLAPFLGRTFDSISGIKEYFKAISVLSYENMKFDEYIVDTETAKVSVVGMAQFTWIETGESWHETFTYRLSFDQAYRVKTYSVWADTGAAYLASQGKLKDLK